MVKHWKTTKYSPTDTPCSGLQMTNTQYLRACKKTLKSCMKWEVLSPVLSVPQFLICFFFFFRGAACLVPTAWKCNESEQSNKQMALQRVWVSEGLAVKQENWVQEIGISLFATVEKWNEEIHLLLEVTFHTFRFCFCFKHSAQTYAESKSQM